MSLGFNRLFFAPIPVPPYFIQKNYLKRFKSITCKFSGIGNIVFIEDTLP